jgi:hypothetical protein
MGICFSFGPVGTVDRDICSAGPFKGHRMHPNNQLAVTHLYARETQCCLTFCTVCGSSGVESGGKIAIGRGHVTAGIVELHYIAICMYYVKQ